MKMHIASQPRPAAPVKVKLPNGKEITVYLWMNNQRKLEVDVPSFGVFEFDLFGLREIATTILEVTGGVSSCPT